MLLMLMLVDAARTVAVKRMVAGPKAVLPHLLVPGGHHRYSRVPNPMPDYRDARPKMYGPRRRAARGTVLLAEYGGHMELPRRSRRLR